MDSLDGLRFRQGAGRLCLDFVRTLRYRGLPDQREELPDVDALAAWLAQFGPELGQVRPSKAQVREAQRLREAVYELVLAATLSSSRDCRPSSLARVNRHAVAAVPAPRMTASGRLRWHADDPVAAVLAQVARDALDLVTSPAIDRVRECGGKTCRALFYDASRPGVRRWCGMDVCGNQAKKLTLRAKAVG